MGVLRGPYLTWATHTNILQSIAIITWVDTTRVLRSNLGELLANARVIDVGCNEGCMPCEIAVSLHLSLSSNCSLTLNRCNVKRS